MTRSMFSPLMNRYLGFDTLFDEIDSLLNAPSATANVGYPPFNIIKREESYIIEMALAGFDEKDLSITHDEKRGTLTISGEQTQSNEEHAQTIFSSIAKRKFSKSFKLAETLKVGNATFKNGLLSISIMPDEMKIYEPKKIQIGSSAPAQPILLNEEIQDQKSE